jgi:hypothetical protein
MIDRNIWTPDTPGFYETLYSHRPPGDLQAGVGSNVRLYAVRHDSLLLEPIFDEQLDDYLYGGEYDEVTDEEKNDEFY